MVVLYGFFFSFLGIVFWVYGRVLFMNDLSLVSRLRNVDWELFLLYRSGDAVVLPGRVDWLWAEVDRLEALIALGG